MKMVKLLGGMTGALIVLAIVVFLWFFGGAHIIETNPILIVFLILIFFGLSIGGKK